MAAESISCPYCNAYLEVPTGATTGERLLCPRCGERVPHRTTRGQDENEPALPTGAAEGRFTASGSPAPVGQEPVSPSRRSNRAVAALVLASMGLMVLIGLTAFLLTKQVRRQHDWNLPKPQLGPHRFVTLVANNGWILLLIFTWLTGLVMVALKKSAALIRNTLGLLTAICLVAALVTLFAGRQSSPPDQPVATPVAAVPPAQLAGLGFLPPDTDVIAAIHVAEALGSPVGKELLSRPAQGQGGFGIANVEKMTGLKLEEIDHIVMGMKVAERALPRMVWIVQSLKPMDRTKVQAALKAARGPDSLRWAGPQTLILAAGPKDLEAVPAEPGAGIGHLPAPLQAFLLERLGKVAQAWVVGSAADWKKTALFFLLKDLPAEEQQVLANVHTLGVWLQCEQELVLNGAAQCADEPAAQALNKYLDRWHKDNFKHFQQETWVTAQARGSVQAMEQTFAGHGKAK